LKIEDRDVLGLNLRSSKLNLLGLHAAGSRITVSTKVARGGLRAGEIAFTWNRAHRGKNQSVAERLECRRRVSPKIPVEAGSLMPPKILRDNVQRVFCSVRWFAAAAVIALVGCGQPPASSTAPSQIIAAEPESKAKESMDVANTTDQTATTAPEQQQPPPADDELLEPFPRKQKLPPEALEGGVEWLNTAGPITLQSLRGKVVLLDFWTYCCINCMHVLPDLKKLEEKYANELVVIGVHSAKFDTERDSQNIREAILRYEIEHPVINDANMIVWRQLAVRAWPTLMLIDPEGCVVGAISGEGVYDALDFHIGRLVKYHRAKKTLKEGLVHFELESARTTDTPLRFPGKVLADAAGGRLFIADSNHNRIVVTTLDGELLHVIGTGEIGRDDGPFDRAKFFRPQGMALDGDSLYVADTENHMIRRVDLKARTVATISGTGEQGTNRSHLPKPAKESALNSPWDLTWHEGKLFIAMAGPHQIWLWNAATDEIHAYAGSGREDIEDGELAFSAFAQPSGLASDGRWLYVADSEGSSIRAVPFDAEREVRTVVGTANLPEGRLFTFGDEDGEGDVVRLQHPLGVAWADGALFVADTYNNKIKIIDPKTNSSATIFGDGRPGRDDDPARLDEPSGLSVANAKLYIADTNNHAIRVADLKTKQVTTLAIAGLKPPKPSRPEPPPAFPNAQKIVLDPQTVAAGAPVELRVNLQLADGFELNDLAPMTYLVEAKDGKDIVRGEKLGSPQQVKPQKTSLTIPLETGDTAGAATLRVSLTFYQCREGASGICEVKQVVWEVPLKTSTGAARKHVDLTATADEPLPEPEASQSPALLDRERDE